MKSVIILIPTYNAGKLAKDFFFCLSEAVKSIEGKYKYHILVVDSGSKDETINEIKKYGFEMRSISSREFNHGGTRNIALEYASNEDYIIFLTQDALLEKDSLKQMLDYLDENNVSAAYGRQLPHLDATPIAKHARYFNYKDQSYISNLSNASELGLKTVFMSNSFSGYNAKIFFQLGGFPSHTILCEDMFFAAKAVLAGYNVGYCASAIVRHSHNYTAIEEFKRYFDIGVFHSEEPWIRQKFGGAGGEGKNFIISEVKYLLKHSPILLIKAMVNNFAKILGYKLGQVYKYLPSCLVKKFSMHKAYWKGIL